MIDCAVCGGAARGLRPVLKGLLGLLTALSLLQPCSAEEARRRYERELSIKALEQAGWVVVEAPEGRQIRALHSLRLPVFMSDEAGGLLTTLNALHVTTKPLIVLREARLKRGDSYDEQRALETERNLRNTGLFTFVQLFAVQPKGREALDSEERGASAEVDLVVVTRELWTLRLESSFEYAGGEVNNLALSLTERNLGGRRQSLSLQSSLSPFTISSGLSFVDPRFGPDLSASASGGLIWGRDSGAQEGFYLSMGLARPLYHQDQPWSLSASGQLVKRRARFTRGFEVVIDEPLEPGERPLEVSWRSESYSVAAGATRQWSGAIQQRLSLSLGFGAISSSPPEGLSAERARRWRSEYMSPDRTQLGPTLSYRLYQRRFTALSDVSSFGLSEDLRLGGSLGLSTGLSLFGDQALIPATDAQWTSTWGAEGARAGFYSVGLSLRARYQPDGGPSPAQAGWVNRRASLSLLGSSPRLGRWGGRVVGSASASGLWRDINNSVVSLGGTQGLRGYEPGALFAQSAHLARLNLEYRSVAWRTSVTHLGAALFYDAGALGRSLSELQAGQSVGLGLRLLFPQLNRSVFRLDLGAPLDGGGWRVNLSLSSSQAFAVMPWESIM